MRRFRDATSAFGLFLLVTSATGAATASAPESPPAGVVEVRLTDGTSLVGTILSEDAETLVLETGSLGMLRVPRSDVVSVETRAGEPPAPPGTRPPSTAPRAPDGYRLDPDRNSILLGPTPETLPAGSGYFRSFELFILNFGFAPSDWLNVSVGTLFPVSSELVSLSGGVKIRLVPRETYGVGLAVAASGTRIDQESFGTISAIAGIGDARKSLNLSLHRSVDDDSDAATFFILGADVQAGPSFKLLAEYANSTDALLEDEDFDGFLNLGFRILGAESSFSLTGFRPLEETGGSFIAFPVLMYSRHF